MQKAQLHIKKNIKAFSLVEVLLAVGIFSLFILGVAGSISFGLQANEVTSYRNRAVYLMDEGMEGVRAIRNEAYSNLVDGTFGLNVTANKWALSGSSSTIGEFSRQIQISTVDATTKKVVTTVSWPQQFGTSNNVTSTMYLTNWLRLVPLGTWTTALLSSTLDLAGAQDGFEVAYSGNYAYVVRYGGTPNFFAINVSNPAAPTIASSLTLTANSTDVFISGNYAYVTSEDNSGELKIINISNPLAVSLVTTFNATGNQNAKSVNVVGNYAYMTRDTGTPNFQIINISNPLIPLAAGTLNLSGNANYIYIQGNYAYLASTTTSQEVQIVNISNPILPILATSINISGNISCDGITGHTTFIFVGCNNGSIYSYNISNPLSPVLLGSFATGATAINDLAISQAKNLLFAGTNNATAEFSAINIAAPASMTSSGTFNAVSTINGLAYDSVNNLIFAVSANDAGEFIVLSSN